MRVKMLRCFVLPVETLIRVSPRSGLFFVVVYGSPKRLQNFSFRRFCVWLAGITWRRDDGSPIVKKSADNLAIQRSDTFEGELLSFFNVDRRHLGAYLCIAKNDVPPAVSKRVFLNVNCKTLA
jgi:hypothetical protein